MATTTSSLPDNIAAYGAKVSTSLPDNIAAYGSTSASSSSTSSSSSDSTSTSKSGLGKTDVVFQEFKLFIEGVQVPFSSIVINQGKGTLPTANIVVPAQAGLMDIARFYQPKVVVFFTDRVNNGIVKDGDKTVQKLIFTGHITSVSYFKTRQGSGSIGIQFGCTHKNHLLAETLVDYSGWLNDTEDNQSGAAVKELHANSGAAVLEALDGIGGGIDSSNEISAENPNGKANVLPKKWSPYLSRLIGMPGALVNYWNQLKRSAYNMAQNQVSDGFTKLYQPLVEDGIHFFERLGGHYLIEQDIEKGRMVYCPNQPGGDKNVLVPPSNRIFMTSAAQAQMTVEMLKSYLQVSGELTDTYTIFDQFYQGMDYEIITLASPAEAPLIPTPDSAKSLGDIVMDDFSKGKSKTSTSAVETIVKPNIPFYFSPTCNVLFPGMYHTLNVTYDEANIPTRVDIKNVEYVERNTRGTRFRAPATVRKAIAAKTSAVDPSMKVNLLASEGGSYGAVGLYEQGRGVKVEYINMPPWLAQLSQSTFAADGINSTVFPDKTKDPVNYSGMEKLRAGWKKRYPNEADAAMNPWCEDSQIMAHHRLLFAAADYYYTQVFARSKLGSVECPFNPYIIPGYPMDILEESPTLPSIHALCSSVTHTITADSVSTSVSFVAATTYSELANYYVPFVHPYMQVALGLAESPTIVPTTATAKSLADNFYFYTLGVTAATPEMIYDFTSTGTPKAVKKGPDAKWTNVSAASVKATNGGELNPNLTYEGQLSLVARPIESRASYESRFGVKFIDMTMSNYSPNAISYTPNVLADSTKLEIGASQFLLYTDISTRKAT